MKRPQDSLRLDVAALCQAAEQLAGQWPGQSLDRLAVSQFPPQDMPLSDVLWQAEGQLRAAPGEAAQRWLSLSASADVWLCCQRCLQPFQLPLQVHNKIRFVSGETQAEALDAEIDDDVLALSRSLDLRVLVEDELLLALPIVPMHEVCPSALPTQAGEAELVASATPEDHPFAKLQVLKSGVPAAGTGRKPKVD